MNFKTGVKVLEKRHSKINGKIEVLKSLAFGTYIQAQGLTQSGGVVKEVWQSTLKKTRAINPNINNCLILGLGGGSVANLVQKYFKKAKTVGVDIDPLMVELGKKYLKLDTKKINIEIQDAYDFVKEMNIQSKKFDLILVDTYSGDKYPKKMEDKKFLCKLKQILDKNGLIVFNRLYWDEKRKLAHRFLKKLEKVFNRVEAFYPEANVMYYCSF